MSEAHYDCPCMEKCPLHHAMQLIGGKWKVQILCAVSNAGAIRYNALRGKLDGISNTVLASALRELERDGLVERQEYLEVPGGVSAHGQLPDAAADPGAAQRLGRSADVTIKQGIFHKMRHEI